MLQSLHFLKGQYLFVSNMVLCKVLILFISSWCCRGACRKKYNSVSNVNNCKIMLWLMIFIVNNGFSELEVVSRLGLDQPHLL